MSERNWPLADVHYLRVLWSQEISTAEIARRMHRSKSGIVGKAHRLGLEGRESPIRRKEGPPAIPMTPRAPKVTLPPMPVLTQVEPITPEPVGDRRCAYLSGESKPYVRCQSPAEPGRPYCAVHVMACYQRVRYYSNDVAI